jgi:RNA polymerase sigma factor (sigma-70 family)
LTSARFGSFTHGLPFRRIGLDRLAAHTANAGFLSPAKNAITNSNRGPLGRSTKLPDKNNVPGESASVSKSSTIDGSVPDDAALVSRCLDGDAAAWEVLVRRYQRLVYAIALRASLDDHSAADVFQTVFARLVQHLPRINQPAKLQAWIVTTAKREVLFLRRRAERTVSMTLPEGDESAGTPEWEFADDSPLPDEALAELQQLAQVRLALDRLDERCRRLLHALFGDDQKVVYDSVARRLGIPRGSIGPTRSRCLAKLRRSLA